MLRHFSYITQKKQRKITYNLIYKLIISLLFYLSRVKFEKIVKKLIFFVVILKNAVKITLKNAKKIASSYRSCVDKINSLVYNTTWYK